MGWLGDIPWKVADALYSSRLLAEALFGVRLRPADRDDHYFDVTTWVLVRRALHDVESHTRVVDLGTGSQGIIGLALWHAKGCPVTAIDIDPELVKLAQASIDHNEAPIHVIQSSLFEEFEEPFDLVTFNPPYIPTEDGLRQGLPESRRSQWDGGEDGSTLIAEFLDALDARTHPLRCLIGVNSMHVPADRVIALIEEHPGLALRETHRSLFLPTVVYVCDKLLDEEYLASAASDRVE